jgi:hypothetical protein
LFCSIEQNIPTLLEYKNSSYYFGVTINAVSLKKNCAGGFDFH